MAVMPQMRLLVAIEPVDFRKGIDGLVAVCRQRLQSDPMSGAWFVFGSRKGRSIKILVYDGQGFWLCQNMHDPHCAVIEDRKDPLPVSSAARPRVGDFRGCRR
jgi:transposase